MQQSNLNDFKDLQKLQSFFKGGVTHSYAFRREQLLKLKHCLIKYETQIITALNTDLAKPALEAYVSEIAILYDEINYALRNLKKWMRREKVATPLMLFRATSYVYKVPLGVILIIAPWNYPVQLLLTPLVGAIAAGNCAVLKPSELMPATSHVIKTMISEVFNSNYIEVVEGDGHIVVPQLINDCEFNHVFFTGSIPVGRSIATLCAQKLIPYTLELGGKSPAIIDKNVNLDVACKRIVWGKFFNSGQTCVAPDYVLVHKSIKADFISKLKHYLAKFLSEESYATILNDKRMQVLQEYLVGLDVIYGGTYDNKTRKFMPTLVDEPPLNAPLMQQEIFGPILPILSYSNQSELHEIIAHNPNPLSLYVFSSDAHFAESIIATIPFGGGCVNTTLMHLANPNLPFGGVMASGQGKYHGKYSFDGFSHHKAIVKMATWVDVFIKYPPYTKLKLSLLKLL